MSNLTKELVREKLTEWIPSTKVQDLLGLSSMDEALFKKELLALEASGVIERDGQRRGLKFKAIVDEAKAKKVKSEEVSSIVEKFLTPKKPKKATEVKDISEIPCQISILPRHEHMSEITNVAINQLIAFILRGGSDNSRSLSIKRTERGSVIVKVYKDFYLLADVTYTREDFNTLLKSSNISLE